MLTYRGEANRFLNIYFCVENVTSQPTETTFTSNISDMITSTIPEELDSGKREFLNN